MATTEELSKDVDWVQACLEGDDSVITEFHQEFSDFLRAFLFKHGAQLSETEEIIPTLLSDCLIANGVKPPLLSKYNGRSSLRSWLCVIALNRWISLKRRTALHQRAITKLENDLDTQESPFIDPLDNVLRKLLVEAVREAINASSPEEIVLLRLVYTHGISQRDLANLWGWHESKMSRQIKSSTQKIARLTTAALKKKDSQLSPKWEDFLEICDHVADWQI